MKRTSNSWDSYDLLLLYIWYDYRDNWVHLQSLNKRQGVLRFITPHIKVRQVVELKGNFLLTDQALLLWGYIQQSQERTYFLIDLGNLNANSTWRQEIVSLVQSAGSIILGRDQFLLQTAGWVHWAFPCVQYVSHQTWIFLYFDQ